MPDETKPLRPPVGLTPQQHLNVVTMALLAAQQNGVAIEMVVSHNPDQVCVLLAQTTMQVVAGKPRLILTG